MSQSPRQTELENILRDLIDPDPCSYDHHGYCQAHSWLSESECPHARAKRLLTPCTTPSLPDPTYEEGTP